MRCWSVQDSGIGTPAKALPRLFSAWFQAINAGADPCLLRHRSPPQE